MNQILNNDPIVSWDFHDKCRIFGLIAGDEIFIDFKTDFLHYYILYRYQYRSVEGYFMDRAGRILICQKDLLNGYQGQ